MKSFVRSSQVLVLIVCFFITQFTHAQDGMISLASPFGAAETFSRAEEVVLERGFTIFARVDHAAGAQTVGQNLRPTMLLIFGNPQGGTPFMQCAQTMGIDLPVKFLVWQDENAQVFLSYNDPVYLANRHDVANCPVAQNMSAALDGIAQAIIAP
jgi:uncharacterized protein (DUF302 family)